MHIKGVSHPSLYSICMSKRWDRAVVSVDVHKSEPGDLKAVTRSWHLPQRRYLQIVETMQLPRTTQHTSRRWNQPPKNRDSKWLLCHCRFCSFDCRTPASYLTSLDVSKNWIQGERSALFPIFPCGHSLYCITETSFSINRHYKTLTSLWHWRFKFERVFRCALTVLLEQPEADSLFRPVQVSGTVAYVPPYWRHKPSGWPVRTRTWCQWRCADVVNESLGLLPGNSCMVVRQSWWLWSPQSPP